MSRLDRSDLPTALATLTRGSGTTETQLIELVYAELRTLAGGYLRGRAGQTLQPTALVHEAFAKVASKTAVAPQDRAHFSALCALAMRDILADHARRRRARKRGGEWQRITLADIGTPSGTSPVDALALDEALSELEKRSERQARVVEYRYFAGMTVEEVMQVMGVSRSTVEKSWRMARAWLAVQLGGTPS